MSTPPITARLEARIAPEVHALLKRAAELQGRTLTDFVVNAAQEAARRAIADSEVIGPGRGRQGPNCGSVLSASWFRPLD